MAQYAYDESGSLAAYFLLTFLAVVLVPLTISLTGGSKARITTGCQCTPCLEQRNRIRKLERGSIFNPQLGLKTASTLAGWALFAFIAYRVAGTGGGAAIYNPFEILGISDSASDKEIKSLFKKLSKQFHPDKVRLTGNMTAETVAAKFVEITKAYKSLTDEVTRENWLKYNNPDGPQQTEMGIALPPWVVEAQNNKWILGIYGLIFGVALPAMVGRWWFGSQAQTKDGVQADTASNYFRALTEDSEISEVVGALAQAAEWDTKNKAAAAVSQRQQHLDALEAQIEKQVGPRWTDIRRLADASGKNHAGRRQALILLYAHLLRLPVEDSSLEKEQRNVILQTPMLLNALLSISLARNWLTPTLAVMRLHAFLAQALAPRNFAKKGLEIAQLPQIKADESSGDVKNLTEFADTLQSKGDSRVTDVNKALSRWPRVNVVDASFRVIDERIITPAAIVYLVVKLRLTPPGSSPPVKEEVVETVDAAKQRTREEGGKDYAFLTGKGDAEEGFDENTTGWAHAPLWPAYRKPGWWLVLADDKSSRVVVPPMKITDIPFADTTKSRDYRSYKLQFQAPPNAGMYTWKLYIVSDTFVGEEIEQNIILKLDDPSSLTAEEQGAEDDISEPDEDTLAGQMAMMRGGTVKPIGAGDDDDDDESGTDDDEEEGSDSSSDSDSD